jgi:hypothetical protein
VTVLVILDAEADTCMVAEPVEDGVTDGSELVASRETDADGEADGEATEEDPEG